MRIEICGGIATGKTTLAHILADSRSGIGLALENFRANPFWAKFYANPKRYMTEKNVCFLAQHTGEIKSFADSNITVCDYAVFQDLAYANLYDDPTHSIVMRELYEHLYSTLPKPDIVVHLKCDPVTQFSRIFERGRKEEQSITIEYLASLNEMIENTIKEFHSYATVHEIHSDKIDFRVVDERLEALRDSILPR
jgi:deoxyadenosine/deoxycytidine kinase